MVMPSTFSYGFQFKHIGKWLTQFVEGQKKISVIVISSLKQLCLPLNLQICNCDSIIFSEKTDFIIFVH